MEASLIESIFNLVIAGFSACVLLVRGICVASKTSTIDWAGRKVQMWCLALGFWMIIGGGVGFCLGWEDAAKILVFGVALFIVSDGRKQHPVEGKS